MKRSTGKVEYLREYSKKIKIVTRLAYWGQEKLFEEKKQRWKIWWHCPFKWHCIEVPEETFVVARIPQAGPGRTVATFIPNREHDYNIYHKYKRKLMNNKFSQI